MYSLIEVIDCLNKEELEVVNAVMDSGQFAFSGSSVFGLGGELTREVKDARSSQGCTLPEDHAIAIILHSAINRALDIYKLKLLTKHWRFNGYPVPGSDFTSSHREGIQVLEYTSGQKYDFHHDDADNPNMPEYHRKISVVLYLKNADLGGGTVFPHTTYKPEPGQALVFPSNWCFPHSGEEVTLGTKRVAVTWYYVQNVLA
jgi:hypothetical protein